MICFSPHDKTVSIVVDGETLTWAGDNALLMSLDGCVGRCIWPADVIVKDPDGEPCDSRTNEYRRLLRERYAQERETGGLVDSGLAKR